MTFGKRFLAGAGQLLCALVLIAGSMTACGDDDDGDGCTGFQSASDPAAEPFELIGEWTGIFGDETITSTSWSGTALIEYDLGCNIAITQTPTTSMFNPGLYSRRVYTEPANDSFFHCTVDFGLATAADARTSTATADATDPATGGCGMFSWTPLGRE